MDFFTCIPLLFVVAGCTGMALSALSVYRLKQGQGIRIERGKPKPDAEFEISW